jgi:hypothetical protein
MSSTFSTRPRLLALLGALLGLVSVGLGVQAAFSKPALAAPSITSKPAAVTSSTSATFTFTGPAGATFQCKLDAAAFGACTSGGSGATFTSLSSAPHTFQVKTVTPSAESTPTSYTWVVDTTPPPAPTLTAKPAAQSNTSAPSFSFTDSESGLTFQCALDAANFSACTSPKSYSGLSQATHMFRVKAIDAAANQGAETSYTWTIDTMAPTAPALTVKPSDPTYNATNFFEWTGPTDAASYQCSLENGAWTTCSTPFKMVIETGNYGLHQFAVRSVDAAGNDSTSTAYTFKYEKKLPDSGLPFTITGQVDPMVIGVWQPIRLTISNPNSVKIYVRELNVSVSGDSQACPSATNLEFEGSNVSPTNLLEVPPAVNGVPGTRTLSVSSGQVSAPRMRLMNLPVNQDVCKGVSFGLSFSGTATN